MDNERVRLYYKNVTADVIGTEHGITIEQFETLENQTSPIIAEINEQRKTGKTPYRDLPYNTDNLATIHNLVDELKDRCDVFVVLGIGGSALGNIALQSALNPYMYNIDVAQRPGPMFFVFDNVDPMQLASFFDWISDKIDRTIFNVISKSGRTAETASQMLIIRQMLIDKLGADGFKNQVIATTDISEGTLRNIADQAKLKTLVVPDGVGGRFSVLSDVGLFSAAMCGIDIDKLLAGARDMDKKVSSKDFKTNPAALNAAINYHYYNAGKKYSVMMPYSNALKDLADWYRQLWAESLGKAVDNNGRTVNIGPTPIKALGTTDQHSQVQLYREGPNDKLFTFLEVAEFEDQVMIGPAPDIASELEFLSGKDIGDLINNEKKATEYALLVNNRPCLTVLFDRINAYTIGQFIYLFEVTTSIAGGLFAINAYDQPAVELAKEATFALMQRQGFEELAEKIRPITLLDEDFLI